MRQEDTWHQVLVKNYLLNKPEMTRVTTWRLITIRNLIKALQLSTCHTATRTLLNASAVDFHPRMSQYGPRVSRPRKRKRKGGVWGETMCWQGLWGNSNFLRLAHKVTLFIQRSSTGGHTRQFVHYTVPRHCWPSTFIAICQASHFSCW